MFDHIGLRVRNLKRSTDFYASTLAPLGHTLQSQGEGYAGLGPAGAPALWLYATPKGAVTEMHLAFRAPHRAAVQAFHARGMAAGARDNGAPGLRADYGADYYAAFLVDPDGNNIEAVCFAAG